MAGIGLGGNLSVALKWIVDLPKASQGQGNTLEARVVSLLKYSK